MLKNVKIASAALLAAGLFAPAVSAQGNAIDQAMFYRSFVQDSPSCSVSVENGVPVFGDAVAGSPASTCPDTFAWVKFTEAIRNEFWEWGTDQTTWPNAPLPICTTEGQTNCCDISELSDPSSTVPTSCPINRADYPGQSPLQATPNGVPSGVVLNHRGVLTDVEAQDPGRLLRDTELEIVFRNAAMVEYIFSNDLYSKEGLGARARAANAALSEGDIGKAHSLEVRFPNDAVMVKADFIHQDIMIARGLIPAEGDGDNPPNDPLYPYLTVKFEGPVIENADGTSYDPSGYYYLLAMTNASKDLPGWHWYAMEHVNNLGRCDFIGCNDSFGFAVTPTDGAGNFGSTFIPPITGLENDQKQEASQSGNPNDTIFVTGERYCPIIVTADDAGPPCGTVTGEAMTGDLAALLRGMGIGQADKDPNPAAISADDPAWKNYRLKGTQTRFTTLSGVPTGMGATITEGGFVNSASCMTCHSQASVDENGNSGVQGVGADWRLNLAGFSQVQMGAPDADWFYNGGSGPSYSAIQIDFIWGILGAACQNPADPSNTHGACKPGSYYDAPKVPYGAGTVLKESK